MTACRKWANRSRDNSGWINYWTDKNAFLRENSTRIVWNQKESKGCDCRNIPQLKLFKNTPGNLQNCENYGYKKGRTQICPPSSLSFSLDPGIRDPKWKKIGIRYKHPGSGTLLVCKNNEHLLVNFLCHKWPLQKVWMQFPTPVGRS